MRIDSSTSGWVHGWMDGHMDEWMDRLTKFCHYLHGQNLWVVFCFFCFVFKVGVIVASYSEQPRRDVQLLQGSTGCR